jgi:hypothetical protein
VIAEFFIAWFALALVVAAFWSVWFIITKDMHDDP